MRGEDMQPPGWRAPDAGAGTRAAGKPAHRGFVLAVGICSGAVAIVLLSACLDSAIMPILAHVLAPSAASAGPSAAAVHNGSIATPASTVGAQEGGTVMPVSADWRTFTSGGGYRMDLPGVLGSSHGYFINDFSGQGVDLSYQGSPITSPLQQLEAQTARQILYSTKITDLNICPRGGILIQMGSGSLPVPAWERNEGSDVVVDLVLNGTAIEIRLISGDGSQPVLPRYAAIWQHMLASFTPLAGQMQHATPPCG